MKRVLSLTLALLMLVTGWIMPVSASETATVEGFEYLLKNETALRNKLYEVMPNYKEKAKLSGEAFKNLMSI